MPRDCQKWIENKSGLVKKDDDMPCSPSPGKDYKKHTVAVQKNECDSAMPIQTQWLQDVQVKKEPINDVPLHQQEGYSVQVLEPLLKCKSEAKWNRDIPDQAEQPREDFGTTASTVKLEEGMQHSDKCRVDNEERASNVEGQLFKLARCSSPDGVVSLQARCPEPTESTANLSKLGRRRRSTRRAVSGTSSGARVPQHLPESPFSRDGDDVAAQEPPDVRYHCPRCNIACPEESSLAIHVRCHGGAGDRRHCCHLCPATFAQKHGLKYHLSQHWGIKPWKCSDCSYACSTKHVLELHIRHRHSGERPFKCDLCDRAFASHSIFMVHRRIHTGEKPYACPLCPATFRDCSAKRKHLLVTHSTARPHTCEHCSKSYALPEQLKRHVITHTGDTPHLCHLCPARFTRHSSLVVHVKNHIGDRSHHCEQCEKSFVTASRLAEHVNCTHSSKPAYPCKLCPRKYKHSGSLNAHVRAEHPAEGKT
ncbi:zinc finger protein 501-like [Dermacentor albipictus]|uniref:zinc finger protein 501-like n=1 Tax=Dermacentor albipictus TaxID=60249 RepID=UPI0031FC20B7